MNEVTRLNLTLITHSVIHENRKRSDRCIIQFTSQLTNIDLLKAGAQIRDTVNRLYVVNSRTKAAVTE